MATPPSTLPSWPYPATATVADIGEHGIIRWIREAAATLPPSPDVVVGIGDDAAVVAPRGNHLDIITTDSQVEGVHFAWALSPPADVGARALQVNLSDLAAMGALPRYALLSLGLPPETPGPRLHALLGGMLEAARASRVALIGGNLSTAPVMTIDVTVNGVAKPRRVLRRAGARPGDEIYVSGLVGAAAAGLAWLRQHPTVTAPTPEGEIPEPMRAAVVRYRRPDARVALGLQVARNRAASACMDTSDGLADALRQLAEASGVGLRIEQALVPVSPAVTHASDTPLDEAWRLAMGGGEDYELVFTVPRRARRAFLHATGRAGLPAVTRIGVCTREAGEVMVEADGNVYALPPGYEHFVGAAAPAP